MKGSLHAKKPPRSYYRFDRAYNQYQPGTDERTDIHDKA